jgi:intein/homing endonuclease
MNIHYIAGFIDAEGCICIQKLRPGRRYREVRLEVVNTHLDTLVTMREFFGIGVVRDRLGYRLGKKPQYKWEVSGADRVREVLSRVRDHLIQKQAKADEALRVLER